MHFGQVRRNVFPLVDGMYSEESFFCYATYIHVSIVVELAKSFWLEAQVYTYFSIVQISVVAYIHIIFPATLYISSTFCIHTVD